MTPVRTAAGVGVGTALLAVLAGCSSDSRAGLGLSAPISASSAAPDPDGPAEDGTPVSSLFSGDSPVSVATWWKDHPGAVPADVPERTLLVNERGTGPQRFSGPDLSKYDRVLMAITCTERSEYVVRLQVLDGLSIASTSGPSCGGPTVAAYLSPSVDVGKDATEVEVEVPEDTEYYVTLYGIPG